ncbi:divalent cation tolerance protein CutA [Pantoea osteomyelitidis]|uniref:Divalent cation tolerance protein CutA n=1 Tax=Pantoea osteomyelitidis TaxID=3230026 RepID=A0ABW7PTI9_9GAMM
MLLSAHLYDVPELWVLPVQHGDGEYLSWPHASLA